MATARPKRDIDPRTPFHQLPGDLLLSTARRLGELGLNEELAAAIRQESNEESVRRMLYFFCRDLERRSQRAAAERQRGDERHQRPDSSGLREGKPHLIRGMFTPPEEQLAQTRAWKVVQGTKWADVPEAWFNELGPAPEWPDGRLQAVVLELALPDLPETKDAEGKTIPAVPGYIRTVCDLWEIISSQHPNHTKWDQLHLDAEHLFLLEGATYEPGLRWRVLDLGANWDKQHGIAPATVRNPDTSPNVDGFAALAHHPRFIRRMDGVKVPYLWIPGFQVTVPGHDPRRDVPLVPFRRDDRQVLLYAYWDGNRNPHCAVPVRLGGGGAGR